MLLRSSHLNRCFRRYLNCSTTAYVIEQRLMRATLLLGTTRSIDDIAIVIFSAASGFSRCFSKHMGCHRRPIVVGQAKRSMRCCRTISA